MDPRSGNESSGVVNIGSDGLEDCDGSRILKAIRMLIQGIDSLGDAGILGGSGGFFESFEMSGEASKGDSDDESSGADL